MKIRTPEELEALQLNTVIEAKDGGIFQRWASLQEDDHCWEAMGTNMTYAHRHIQLPAAVLKESRT